jgi:hypothetical protein
MTATFARPAPAAADAVVNATRLGDNPQLKMGGGLLLPRAFAPFARLFQTMGVLLPGRWAVVQFWPVLARTGDSMPGEWDFLG